MRNVHFRAWLIGLILGSILIVLPGLVFADPPARVARLGYISGVVSFSPAGENDWVQAIINRPLITGDRLWVAPGARAEVQVGVAAVRLDGGTSMTMLNLDDRVTQMELTQGALNIYMRRSSPEHVFEVDTPNLAFSLRQRGSYRIEASPDEDATTVLVREGQADVYGEGAAYTIAAPLSYRYYGTGLRDYDFIARTRVDEFDRWSQARDRRAERSVSLRYVSPDVIGYEDLDANGTWRSVADYGNVWVPNRVANGWAPYRDGHWSWVEPWGWTWVDDAPWGFAVSHYGRWANLGGTWGWVPGPARQQAVYAPALVAFVGGANFRLALAEGNIGAVAWFPLGPRDVYRPSYPVSRDYFTRVNVSNTVINNTNITNVYNNTTTNVTYINQSVPGAVVAVRSTAFVQSQPVSRAAVRVNVEQFVNAPVTAVAAFAPVQRSVIGPAAPAARPLMQVVERPVVVRTAPPPRAIPFAARESALAATPGKPLTADEVHRLKPGAPAEPVPAVVVAAPVGAAVPMSSAQPSRPDQGGSTRGESGAPGQRGRIDQGAPQAGTPSRAQPLPVPPVGAAAPDPRAAPGFRERGEPVPATPVSPVVRPQPAPPVVSAPAPRAPVLTAPPDSRAPGGQRGRPEAPGNSGVDTRDRFQTAPPPPPESAPADQRPGPRGRVEPQPAAKPPVAEPTAKPQTAPVPPTVAPAERQTSPGQRGRPDTQETVAPPSPRAQPVSPAPVPPAIAPIEQRTPPGQGRRPAEQPAQPQVQPGPNAQPPSVEQRGAPSKPGAPKGEDKRSPEQIKADEQPRQDEERKGRRPN